MQLEARKLLFDIQQASELVTTFTDGRTFENYAADVMLRSAVERQFEKTGEALSKLSRLDLALAERISEYRRIIAFRNILIHGYADVDDRLVWDIVESKLPVLRTEIATLLAED